MLQFNAIHFSPTLLQMTGKIIFICISVIFLKGTLFNPYRWQILRFITVLFFQILSCYVTINVNVTSMMALVTYSNCINAMFDTARYQLELLNENDS